MTAKFNHFQGSPWRMCLPTCINFCSVRVYFSFCVDTHTHADWHTDAQKENDVVWIYIIALCVNASNELYVLINCKQVYLSAVPKVFQLPVRSWG